MIEPREWNPRFVAYAKSQGRAPEEQLEHDREAWPGGVMAGFILWMRERWDAWWETRKKTASARTFSNHIKTEADQASFDAFLARSSKA